MLQQRSSKWKKIGPKNQKHFAGAGSAIRGFAGAGSWQTKLKYIHEQLQGAQISNLYLTRVLWPRSSYLTV